MLTPQAFAAHLRATLTHRRDAVETAFADDARATILVPSQAIVPLESGDLEKDGMVTSERHGDGFAVRISYGNSPETAAYALPQHERTDYRHKNGRTAGYLRIPAQQSVIGREDRIKEHLHGE